MFICPNHHRIPDENQRYYGEEKWVWCDFCFQFWSLGKCRFVDRILTREMMESRKISSLQADESVQDDVIRIQKQLEDCVKEEDKGRKKGGLNEKERV